MPFTFGEVCLVPNRPNSIRHPLTPSPCLGFTTLPDPDSCYVDTSVLVECSEAGAVPFSGHGLWEEPRRQPCPCSRAPSSSSWTSERTWNSQKPGHARSLGRTVLRGCGSKREGDQAPVGIPQWQRQSSAFSTSVIVCGALHAALAYMSFLLTSMIHISKSVFVAPFSIWGWWAICQFNCDRNSSHVTNT